MSTPKKKAGGKPSAQVIAAEAEATAADPMEVIRTEKAGQIEICFRANGTFFTREAAAEKEEKTPPVEV